MPTVTQLQLQHLRQEFQCSATLEQSSLYVQLCNLGIPWCGRQLQWQVLIPTNPATLGAPDFIFDDDSFQPLCAPIPLPLAPPCHAASTSTSSQPHSHPPAAAPLRALLRAWPVHPNRPDGLTCLVSELLELYRQHQVRRLERAAAGLPRLQFELSTLELGPGVQLELQAQQASFSLPLPDVGINHLLEVAYLYGARLPYKYGKDDALSPLLAPEHLNSCSSAEVPGDVLGQTAAAAGAAAAPQQPAEQQQQQQAPGLGRLTQNPGGSISGSGGRRQGGEDVSGPEAAAAHGAGTPPNHPHLQHEQQLQQRQGGGPGAAGPTRKRGAVDPAGAAALGGVASPEAQQQQPDQQQRQQAAPQPLPRSQQLVLLASFRLPTASAGDLSDPELSLQLPPVLSDLKAFPGGGTYSRSPALASASSPSPPASFHSTGTGTSPAAAGTTAPATRTSTSGPSGGSSSSLPPAVPLVPSLQLPLWSEHMCMAEYVHLATERLAAQLEAHCALLLSRQQVLEQLGEALGPPLELHLAGGTALFSLAWEGCPVLAVVELGSRFPADKPVITLHCVRQLNSPDAVRIYRDYPWSPRWSPQEVAARVHNWLKEELPNFMKGRPTA